MRKGLAALTKNPIPLARLSASIFGPSDLGSSEKSEPISIDQPSKNLNLNVSKSSEIIFTSSYQRRKTPLPATIPGISRSGHITIPGVVFSSTLKFSQHVENILSKATTAMFALRTLRAHGMAQASTSTSTICGDACPLSCASAEAYKLAQCTRPQ